MKWEYQVINLFRREKVEKKEVPKIQQEVNTPPPKGRGF
jgi:hypothetical protein